MSKNTQAVRDDVNVLAADARALMAATANVAEEQVVQARQRLAAALKRGQKVYDRVRDEAVAELEATNQTVHEHPYPAISLALASASCSAVSPLAGAPATAAHHATESTRSLPPPPCSRLASPVQGKNTRSWGCPPFQC